MKVGIITFHNANNYGAVLQCYALQNIVSKMGHDVSVINYNNSFIESLYVPKLDKRMILHEILHLSLFEYLNAYKTRKERYRYFKDFRERFLSLSTRIDNNNLPQDYDAYIIGSDQMWSLQCGGGYDSVFFGQFQRPASSRLIGYSISGTGDFIPYFSLEQLNSIVSNFDYLSFREEKLSRIVGAICNSEFPVTIDPTLLTKAEDWDALLDNSWSNKQYVVLFQMGAPKYPNQNAIREKAKKYADECGYELIDLLQKPMRLQDFVSAIKFARCVFTTSFHATAFSVIFNTPFLSFCLHNGRDDRYVNLLKAIGLESRLCEYNDSIHDDIQPMDKEQLAQKLESLSSFSLQFLKESLSIIPIIR